MGSEAFRDPARTLLRTNHNQGDFLLGFTFLNWYELRTMAFLVDRKLPLWKTPADGVEFQFIL